jgi:hypothetical protein
VLYTGIQDAPSLAKLEIAWAWSRMVQGNDPFRKISGLSDEAKQVLIILNKIEQDVSRRNSTIARLETENYTFRRAFELLEIIPDSKRKIVEKNDKKIKQLEAQNAKDIQTRSELLNEDYYLNYAAEFDADYDFLLAIQESK